MPNILEVQIVGDISSLEKSLNDAKKLQAEYTDSIKSTSDEIAKLNKQKISDKKLGVDVTPLNKQISKLQDNLLGLRGNLTKAGFDAEKASKSIDKLSAPIEDVGSSAAGSAADVVGLVDPLLEASGASKEVAAGANILTSALSGGLAGAISAAVGYLIQMYLEAQNAKTALQELNTEAIKGSQAQISEMNAYVSAASNVNLSMSDRLIAVQKLQSEYPAYFGNLTKEQILNGNVASAVRGATQALIAKAKASAAVDKIVKLAEEEANIQNTINNIVSKSAKIYSLTRKEAAELSTVINEQIRLGKSSTSQLLELGESLGYSTTKMAALAVASNDINGVFENLGQNLITNKREQDKYTESINKNIAAQIKLETETGSKERGSKVDVTPKVEAVPTFIFDPNKVQDELRKELEVLKFYLGDAEKDFKKNPIKLNIPLQAVTTGSEFEVYAAKLRQAKEDTQIFADGAGAAVGSLASGLTSSLETGNAALDAFVGSVIQGFAEVVAAQITGLIAQQAVATASLATNAAVSTGNAVTAATSTAAATGPAAAFVLPALVGAAIGFIAAAFAGIKFAHGGIVPGGSFTGDKIPAMLNSGEAVMNQQQQANTLMAIANGNSNSLQGNIKSSTFNLETKLRGSDILLALKREEKSR